MSGFYMSVTEEEFKCAEQNFKKISDGYFFNREDFTEDLFMLLMRAQAIYFDAKEGNEELRVKFVKLIKRIENMICQTKDDESLQR